MMNRQDLSTEVFGVRAWIGKSKFHLVKICMTPTGYPKEKFFRFAGQP